ncbi:MAG: TolC family protein [Deltaproteobacteria bacterium]
MDSNRMFSRLRRWFIRAAKAVLMASFFCLLPVPAPCGDQPSGQARLTIDKARSLALENNPSIRAARAGSEATSARVSAAWSAFFPRLDLYEAYERTNTPPAVFTHKLSQEIFSQSDFAIDRLNDPSPISNWKTRLVLTQPLFTSGREITGLQMAHVQDDISAIETQAQEQEVIFRVDEAFFQAILARERVEVLDAALETTRADERLAEERHAAGLALKSDALAAHVQLISREKERLQAAGDMAIALARLNEILGLPQSTPWELAPPDGPLPTPDPDEAVETWITRAHTQRPEILLASKQGRLAELRVREARLRFLPDLTLSGAYEANASDFGPADGDSWGIGVIASLNLFSGLGDRARVAEANAEAKRTGAQMDSVLSRVEREVREAFIRRQVASRQLQVSHEAVAQAEESLRILRERYSNGLALMAEVLAAEEALRAARLSEVRARFDVRLALSALELSAGVLAPKTLP